MNNLPKLSGSLARLSAAGNTDSLTFFGGCTSSSYRSLTAQVVPKIEDDAKVIAETQQCLKVTVGTCEDISIGKDSSSPSFDRIRVIGRKCTGDLSLRYANRRTKALEIWVEDVQGDVHLPRKSFLTSSFKQSTDTWLSLHIGKFPSEILTEYESRIAGMKEKVAEEAGKGLEQKIEDLTIRSKTPEGSDVYLGEVGDDVKINCSEDVKPVGQLNIVFDQIEEIEF